MQVLHGPSFICGLGSGSGTKDQELSDLWFSHRRAGSVRPMLSNVGLMSSPRERCPLLYAVSSLHDMFGFL